jgi:TRAP-type C4-dicarboxylate transport system permease small subunit
VVEGYMMRKFYLNFFDVFKKISDLVVFVSDQICYLLVVLVTIDAGLAVFYRYVWNQPLRWTEEAGRYGLIWLTMLTASVAVRERKHIILEVVVSRLPKKLAICVEIVLSAVIIIIIGIITKHCWIMAFHTATGMYAASLDIRMVWPYAALPVGFLLIIYHALYVILEDIKRLITKESVEGFSMGEGVGTWG